MFPALEALKTSDTDRVELVNQTIVEEVLQDLGELDFGKGITADSNIASGANAAPTIRCAASSRSRPSSSAGTNSTRRRLTASAVLHRAATVRP